MKTVLIKISQINLDWLRSHGKNVNSTLTAIRKRGYRTQEDNYNPVCAIPKLGPLARAKCSESPTGEHNFCADLEYDDSGNTVNCEHCGCLESE